MQGSVAFLSSDARGEMFFDYSGVFGILLDSFEFTWNLLDSFGISWNLLKPFGIY